MRKCLFTYISSDFEEVLEVSKPTHEYFAELFGYDYFVFNEAELKKIDKTPNWDTKFQLFNYLLKEKDYELAFWIDADALFSKFDTDVVGEIYANSFQAFAMEISSRRWNPNTGVWIMKQNEEAFSFIDDAIKTGIISSCWKDQAAVMNLLGWNMDSFPGGNKIISPSKYLKNTDWLDPLWNYIPSITDGLPEKARIIHLAGANLTNQERAEEMLRMRGQLQRRSIRRLPWTDYNSNQGHRSYDT